MAFKRRHDASKDKILDVDASMQGTMSFKDPVNLRINGKFEGKLRTKGNLTIGENAVVNADIDGERITIAGRVSGDINALSELNLVSPAYVTGDVKTPLLRVAEGAIIDGHVSMVAREKAEKDLTGTLTIDEVAKFLEVDKNVVVEWADTGKLPAKKDGSKWRFDRSKIEDWLASEKIK